MNSLSNCMSRRTLVVMVMALFAAGMSQSAAALPASLPSMNIGMNNAPMEIGAQHGQFDDLGDGLYSWQGEIAPEGAGWTAEWDLVLDPDPGISGVIAVTNITANPTDFSVSFTLPVVGSYPAGSLMSGSSSITVSDADFDNNGEMQAVANSSIYSALIEGVVQRTLFDDPYSLSPTFPPVGNTNSDTMTFSGENTSTDLTSELGLDYLFTLSGGDKATVNSTFFVVPEPITGLLLLCGAVPLLRRRSRRA